MMEFRVLKDAPTDVNEWNGLCKSNSNINQTTFAEAAAQNFKPYYIEGRLNGNIAAGTKVTVYTPGSLPGPLKSLGITANLPSENLFAPTLSEEEKDKLNIELSDEVKKFLKQQGVTSFKASNFFGNINRLYQGEGFGGKEIQLSFINLNKTVDEMWEGVHSKHRNVIRKAETSGVTIVEDDNINAFLDLLKSTYDVQGKAAPEQLYIKSLYDNLRQYGLVKLYFAAHEDKYLSGAFMSVYGDYVYYLFGGNAKTNITGPGNLLHWEMMKKFKEQGFKKYYFGQVAKEVDEANLKFTEGITRFKMRFGCEVQDGIIGKQVFSPLKVKLWQQLVKLKG